MSTLTHHAPGSPCWLDLATSDAAAARAFYGNLFGWTYDIAGPEMGFYAMVKLGDRFVGGIGQAPPQMNVPPAWTPYLACADAQATLADVQARGGRLVFGPMDIPGQGVQVVAADPTGAVFGFWQAKPFIGTNVLGETGALAWCEVNTREAAVARDFYAAVFGLVPTPLPGGTEYYTLALDGEPRAGVLQMDAQWPASIPAHWMVYFAVDDTDAAVEKVKALGGAMHVPPFDTPFGRIAVLADPQGAVFSVVTLPRPA